MTAMAAEAGTAEVEGEAAEAPRAARKATTRPRRSSTARTARNATPAGRTLTAAQAARQRHAARVQAGNQRQPLPAGVARNRRVIRQGAVKVADPGRGKAYHGVILAEWVLAFLLVAAIPLSRKNKTGVSPYSGNDMVQLGALTVLYWILAITAATGRTPARFAAWFGALILLAVGLAEASNIASAVNTWLNPAPAKAASSGPKPNASVVNPPSTATGLSRNVAQQPGTGLS